MNCYVTLIYVVDNVFNNTARIMIISIIFIIVCFSAIVWHFARDAAY